MTRSELRQLRFQSLAMAALLLMGGSAAAIIGMNRSFFEGFIKETYASDLPLRMHRVVERAAGGSIEPRDVSDLEAAEKLGLYDYWMSSHADELRALPRALVGADADLILARTRRTLASGSREQKVLAVTFLELAGDGRAIHVLRRVGQQAERRGDVELQRRVDEAIHALSEGAAC